MTKNRTIQIYRGTTAQNDAYTGFAGELTMDTDKKEIRLHDGSTQGGKVIGAGGAGLDIGDMFYTMRTDNELNGAVECDGATYNTTDFTGAQSIGTLLEAGKLNYISLTQYATEISTKGWCDKIGWNGTGNTQFRVPTLTPHIVETNNIPVVGNGKALGFTSDANTAFGLNVAGGTPYQDVMIQTSGNAYGTNVGTATTTTTQTAHTSIGLVANPATSGLIADLTNTSQPRVMIQLAVSASDEAVETCTGVLADVADLKDLSNITASAKEVIAHNAMPSNRYINLTLGASDSSYTAPADGYVAFCKQSSGANQNVNIQANGMMEISWAAASLWNLSVNMPVKKGDTFTVSYTTGNATQWFRFVYAQGAQ